MLFSTICPIIFQEVHIKGYIEGILQAQLRIYGYYFIDELITDELLDSVNQSFRKIGQTSLTLNRKGLSFAIASEITNLERCFLLEQMSELFNTHFYTTKPHSLSDHVISLGPVKYMEEMPCVFRYSKLNLYPTLKSIQSGIPLRALDIMGSKGVLLSNFQPELVEYFEDGQDLILYSSMEESVEKAACFNNHILYFLSRSPPVFVMLLYLSLISGGYFMDYLKLSQSEAFIRSSSQMLCIVSGGGITPDGKIRQSKGKFFIPVFALRYKFEGNVLLTGFLKIRYYSFLNNRMKSKNLKLIFKLQGYQKFKQRYAGRGMRELLKQI